MNLHFIFSIKFKYNKLYIFLFLLFLIFKRGEINQLAKKQITPAYSFDKATYVKFLDRTDFSIAKYNDISLEGFSCFCNKPIQKGEKSKVEINLKMMSGGLIDDMEMHIAEAELIDVEENDGEKIYQFKFIEFEENCFDNLKKAIDFLDQKETLISLPDMSIDNIEAQDTISNIVKDMSERIDKGQISLPVLPKIVQEVEEAIKNPEATNDHLAQIIEKDSVISVKLISTANSPFYRGASHIVSVRETIPRLGIKEVQNLVLTIANKSLYKTKNKQFKMLLEKLWLHSLACAVNAKAIALKLGLKNADSCFTMGIVHDIGQTMLLRVIGEMTKTTKTFETFDVIDSTNKYKADIGKVILRYWKFSDGFIEAVTTYKGHDFNEKTPKETLVLNIANNLTYQIGYGITERMIDLQDLEAVKILKVSPLALLEIGEETQIKMESSNQAF